MTFQKRKAIEWQKLAFNWLKFKPPYKPSQQRLKLYRQMIKKYCQGNKALVLGATPEVRDLLAKLRFQVTIFDFSPVMVKAMTALRKTKSRERIIIGDWLKRLREQFDLMIGDTVVNNLEPSDYLKFFKKASNLLKKNGVFLQEIVGDYRKKKKIATIERLIRKLKKQPYYFKKYSNRVNEYFLFWPQFRYHGLVTANEVEDWVAAQVACKLNKQQQRLLHVGLHWQGSFLARDEIEKKLNQVFKIVEKRIDSKELVYQNFYRLYVLKKK